jgi:DNA-binding Lrp family transcriptional regulator
MGDSFPAGNERIVKKLYKDATSYEDKIGNLEPGNIPAGEPVGIVDPRYLGLNYPSYVFIETGKSLEEAIDPEEELFSDGNIKRGTLTGLSLGEYDIIHRRAEIKKYSHANFAVDATDELEYCRTLETYPIFTLGRWHGQDVRGHRTLNYDPELTPFESEIINHYIDNPNADPADYTAYINNSDRLDESYIEHQVETKINELEDEGVIIGTSVPVKPANISNFEHVIIGMSVGEREGNGNDDEMPNEQIIRDIMKKYDGWEMPYIASGVGQNWADIIAEMHIDEISDMNQRSAELRNEIDGVRSTETFLLTQDNVNRPLKVSSPRYIPANVDSNLN